FQKARVGRVCRCEMHSRKVMRRYSMMPQDIVGTQDDPACLLQEFLRVLLCKGVLKTTSVTEFGRLGFRLRHVLMMHLEKNEQTRAEFPLNFQHVGINTIMQRLSFRAWALCCPGSLHVVPDQFVRIRMTWQQFTRHPRCHAV